MDFAREKNNNPISSPSKRFSFLFENKQSSLNPEKKNLKLEEKGKKEDRPPFFTWILVGGGLALSLHFAKSAHASSLTPPINKVISSSQFTSSFASGEVGPNKPSSYSQHPFPAHSSTSQGVFSSPRAMSPPTCSSQVKTLWAEKPKTLKARERVMWKEPLPFEPACLPVLPRRRSDKKGGIRASTRDNSQEKDLRKGEAYDPKIVHEHAQAFQTAIAYAMYYHLSMQLPYALPFLRQIVPIIAKNAMEAFQTLPTDLEKTLNQTVPKVLPHLSNLGSGLNMVRKTFPINSSTNKKEKNKMILSDWLKMILSDRFKEGQSLCLNYIENDPILKEKVLTAHNNDFISFVSGGEGTFYRFKTLKEICTKNDIDYFQLSYKKGILYPVRNLTLGASYLAGWDHPSYPFSTGSDQFIQGVLQKTAAVAAQKSRYLERIMILEDFSVQQEPHFVTLRLLGEGMSCLAKRINGCKKSVSPKDVSFWTKNGKQLISESFAEGSIELEKNGTPSAQLKNSLNELIEEYEEYEE